MTLDEAIKRFSDNAEYERSHGSLQGCLEFRQLAEWLAELKKLKEQTEQLKESPGNFNKDSETESMLNADLISRQAVLSKIETVCFSKRWSKFRVDHGSNGTRDYIINYIKRLPSVQPQTVGKWILLDECSNSGYYCSECHKRVVKEGWSNTVKKIKHCPNCGAKMEEGE